MRMNPCWKLDIPDAPLDVELVAVTGLECVEVSEIRKKTKTIGPNIPETPLVVVEVVVVICLVGVKVP